MGTASLSKVCEIPSQKKDKNKRAEAMAQVVEHMHRRKALHSIPSTAKKNQNKKPTNKQTIKQK
jgi:hypothetical protein